MKKWGEQDSNLRSHKTTELQSVPVGRFGISPTVISSCEIKITFTDDFERKTGLKPATLSLEG